MVAEKVRKALANPGRVPSYVRWRLRDWLTPGRLSFDQQSVTGTRTAPELAREIHTDVELLNRGLGDMAADRSLEVGCGFGRLTPWIARYADSHVAIEPEGHLIADAAAQYPNDPFVRAGGQRLPFPADTFDLVVTTSVLMHVPPDAVGDIGQELVRVATDDAVVTISEKTGGEDDVGRVFARSPDTYAELLGPFELEACYERPVEPWRDPLQQHLLRFER